MSESDEAMRTSVSGVGSLATVVLNLYGERSSIIDPHHHEEVDRALATNLHEMRRRTDLLVSQGIKPSKTDTPEQVTGMRVAIGLASIQDDVSPDYGKYREILAEDPSWKAKVPVEAIPVDEEVIGCLRSVGINNLRTLQDSITDGSFESSTTDIGLTKDEQDEIKRVVGRLG